MKAKLGDLLIVLAPQHESLLLMRASAQDHRL